MLKITPKFPLMALCLALSISSAHAQFGRNPNNQQFDRAQNGDQFAQQNDNDNGGVLPLPDGVRRVISIDAQNVLLAELEGADGSTDYGIIAPQHIYSGGLARLFGGAIIPTEQFVSPAFNNSGGGFGDTGFNGNDFNNRSNNGNGNNNFNGNQNQFQR